MRQSIAKSAANAVIALFAVLACTQALSAQSLRIGSPASGTVVHPGESVPVTVNITGTFQQVGVIGEIGTSQMLATGPYDFWVLVPANIPEARVYNLTAVGMIGPSNIVGSEPMILDVEPRSKPASLKIQGYPYGFEFQEIGDKSSLLVVGRFRDGSTMYMTQSTIPPTFPLRPPLLPWINMERLPQLPTARLRSQVDGVWRIPVTVRVEPQLR